MVSLRVKIDFLVLLIDLECVKFLLSLEIISSYSHINISAKAIIFSSLYRDLYIHDTNVSTPNPFTRSYLSQRTAKHRLTRTIKHYIPVNQCSLPKILETTLTFKFQPISSSLCKLANAHPPYRGGLIHFSLQKENRSTARREREKNT